MVRLAFNKHPRIHQATFQEKLDMRNFVLGPGLTTKARFKFQRLYISLSLEYQNEKQIASLTSIIRVSDSFNSLFTILHEAVLMFIIQYGY